jgi:thiopeptide-type bacteriocin biosynthesis protein
MPEWLYVKLPCPVGCAIDADEVLRVVVAPTAAVLRDRSAIDRFFFLRYFEGGLHVRYRLRLTGLESEEAVRGIVYVAATEAGLAPVGAVYEQELWKYGGPEGLDIAERHFTASSVLALSCIERTPRFRAARAMVAMQAFKALLTEAGIIGLARTRFLLAYRDYWRSVYRAIYAHPPPVRGADAETRAWMGACGAPDDMADVVGEIAGPGLNQWLDALHQDVTALRALVVARKLTTTVEHVVSNFAHTFHNRLGLGVADEVLLADYLLGAPCQ